MRKLFILSIALLSFGCSTFQSRPFDPNEYSLAVSVAANATHAVHRCDSRDGDFKRYISEMNRDTFLLGEYVANKDDRESIAGAVGHVRAMTLAYALAGAHSSAYCRHKLSNVQAASRMLARSIGDMTEHDPCEGDVEKRYFMFEKSMSDGTITSEEFKDLVDDLVGMKKIDASSCSLANRQKMEDGIRFIERMVKVLTIF